MSPTINVSNFFPFASCTLHLPISWGPALEQASSRVIKPFMKFLNCLWRRETFLWTSKSFKRVRLQVPLQEKSFTLRFIRHTLLFSKDIFQSQFSSEDITYNLPGKQKTGLYSLQLLCNTTWKDVKLPGVILNTLKSF